MDIHKTNTALTPLFERAYREKLWFYTDYQNLWFSPKELKAENERGSFNWGPGNWELRDPQERLEELAKELEKIQAEMYKFSARIINE